MSEELKNLVSHHEREIEELRADPTLAGEYLKVAMASLSRPDERAGALIVLRVLAEAYGGLSMAAAQAGISLDALSSTLSQENVVP